MELLPWCCSRRSELSFPPPASSQEMLVCGGLGSDGFTHGECHAYSVSQPWDGWTQVPGFRYKRQQHSMGEVAGRVLVLGGVSDQVAGGEGRSYL